MNTLHHYWRSSSSWRVRWALAEKGIPFVSVTVDLLAGQQDTAAHRETSPTGYVPALVLEDGRVLGESVAICEYLDDTFPDPPLRPSDPFHRARMRQLVEIVNSATQPVQNLGVLRRVSSDKTVQAEWAHHFIARGLAAAERLLTIMRGEGLDGPFALGHRLTLADVFLVPQLYNARRFSVDLTPFPRLCAVEEAAKATASHLASCPDAWQPPAS